MTEELLRKSLSRCPLFGGLSRETLDSLTGDDRAVRTYTDGEIIGSTDESGLPLLIVLAEGKATVTTPNAGRNVLLRFLGAGDLFGIANLFSDAPSVSTVRASGGCTCLLIPEDTVRALLDRDRGFRQNYIGYLSGRVRFLNRKIGYLTAGSAERRLALYLAGLGQGEVTLTESLSSLSELLNLGRASLYRAFDRLTADGYLVKNGKHLTLPDPSAMLAHYNQ